MSVDSTMCLHSECSFHSVMSVCPDNALEKIALSCGGNVAEFPYQF